MRSRGFGAGRGPLWAPPARVVGGRSNRERREAAVGKVFRWPASGGLRLGIAAGPELWKLGFSSFGKHCGARGKRRTGGDRVLGLLALLPMHL